MAVPDPPWWHRRAESGRDKPQLTRDLIVDAALALLERDGLQGLSMRRLAQELGTGAASLYWHIGSKDELLDLVLDRAIGELTVPQPDAEHWQEQLAQLALEGRAVLKRHRDLARLSLGRIPTGPNLMRMSEAMLAILRAGLPDRVAALAADMVALYIGAYVFEESLAAAAAAPADADPAAGRAPEMVTEFYASLPGDLYPNVVELARSGDLTAGDTDERFRFGIDVLIRGLATLGIRPS